MSSKEHKKVMKVCPKCNAPNGPKVTMRTDTFKKRSTDVGQVRHACPHCGYTEVDGVVVYMEEPMKPIEAAAHLRRELRQKLKEQNKTFNDAETIEFYEDLVFTKIHRRGIYGCVELFNSNITADAVCSIDWPISDGYEPKEVLDILNQWLDTRVDK